MDQEVRTKAREFATFMAQKFPNHQSVSLSVGNGNVSVAVNEVDQAGETTSQAWAGKVQPVPPPQA